jgi:HSP20 family molecular chaperone IbpA
VAWKVDVSGPLKEVFMKAAELVEVKASETPEETKRIILDELRRDFGEWMMAKEDLVLRPSVELTKEGNEFAVRALVPGIDPKDIQIMVAPDILLIKGENHRKLLRSIEFPMAINPAKVHAELKDGMLAIKARIARTERFEIVMPRAA